jgi:hypothetical protein
VSYAATVFNVLIVSPSDITVERNLVREVIHEWNGSHSHEREIIFRPVGWETDSYPSLGDRPQGVLNKQIVDDADLIVAVFWNRLGTPTGEAESGSVEELERHMAAGKPAMVYFSSTPVKRESVDDEQWKRLVAFRKKLRDTALTEDFEGPDDFRRKFARQLATAVNKESHFTSKQKTAVLLVPAEIPDRHVPTLSSEAQQLLLEGAQDKNGQILLFEHMGGLVIQSNRKKFVEGDSPRSRAIWESALSELERNSLITGGGARHKIYKLTREGYEMAERLKP